MSKAKCVLHILYMIISVVVWFAFQVVFVKYIWDDLFVQLIPTVSKISYMQSISLIVFYNLLSAEVPEDVKEKIKKLTEFIFEFPKKKVDSSHLP